MVPERSITPEKQLLRLIEEHKAHNTATLQVQALKHHNLSFLSLGAWAGRFSFFKDWLQKRLHTVGRQPLDIKVISQAAVICIYILAVYFLFDFISSLTGLRKIPNLEIISSEKMRPLSFQENSVLKTSASYYVDNVRGRDLFKLEGGRRYETTKNKEVKAPVVVRRVFGKFEISRDLLVQRSPTRSLKTPKLPRLFLSRQGTLSERAGRCRPFLKTEWS